MIEIDKLKFDKNGLIPAVITDFYSKKVLMVAYMNAESLQISISEGRTCFWSRSRNCLWRKGETSGNYQQIVSIIADCDYDALTVEVIKNGPACHTGTDSCFNNYVYKSENLPEFSFDCLDELLQARKTEKPQGSYTTYLFEQGIDKILKKIGEESTEVIVAAKGAEKAETIYEIADLAYHVMVLMAEMQIEPKDILQELSKRHIIDYKVKQQKMR